MTFDPMPDEMAISHEWRCMWMGGYTYRQKYWNHLLHKHGVIRPVSPQVPRLNLLAMESQIGLEEYAARHSMMAILRFAAAPSQVQPYGSSISEGISERNGMRSPKDGQAFLCPFCAAHEYERLGFSWFHRAHHIPGLDWCPHHQSPLRRVLGKQPFDGFPHSLLAEGATEAVDTAIERLPETGFFARLAAIAELILHRTGPALTTKTHRALLAQAMATHVQRSHERARPCVSDLIMTLVPPDWIARNLPGKIPHRFYRRVDSIMVHNSPAAGDGYLFTLAALYSSAEDAVSALAQTVSAPESGTSEAIHQYCPSHQRESRSIESIFTRKPMRVSTLASN